MLIIHEVAVLPGSYSICSDYTIMTEVKQDCSFDYRAKKTLQETVAAWVHYSCSWSSLYLSGFDLKVCWTLQPLTVAMSLQSPGIRLCQRWFSAGHNRSGEQRECSGGTAFPDSCGCPAVPPEEPGLLWPLGGGGTACCTAGHTWTSSAASLLWQWHHSRSCGMPWCFGSSGEGLGCSVRAQAVQHCRQGRVKPPVLYQVPRSWCRCHGEPGLCSHCCSALVFLLHLSTTVLWLGLKSTGGFLLLQLLLLCLKHKSALALFWLLDWLLIGEEGSSSGQMMGERCLSVDFWKPSNRFWLSPKTLRGYSC